MNNFSAGLDGEVDPDDLAYRSVEIYNRTAGAHTLLVDRDRGDELDRDETYLNQELTMSLIKEPRGK